MFSYTNNELFKIYEEIVSGEWQKRPYINLKRPSQRCELGRAVIYGMTTALRYYYKKNYPKLKLTDPTVRLKKNSIRMNLTGDRWRREIV